MKKFFLTIAVVIGIVSISCGGDDSSGSGEPGGSGSQNNEFDRSAILVSWADDFIIPQLDAFLAETKLLTAAKDSFVANANETNLISLRVALTNTYLSFQPIATYAEFGLAAETELAFYFNLNAHPLNVGETESNIVDVANVDLNTAGSRDAQGLPAVDYLVNGLGDTDADIAAFYTGAEADNYKTYLSLVVDRIENITQQVVDSWANGYRATFVENTSSSSAGSFDVFINNYIEYFERRLRASKVGIPAGVFTTNTFPDQIESLYNPTLSKELLLVALDNAEALYLGAENSEQSLSSILIDLEKTELDTEIKGFFTAAQVEINDELMDDLRLQVITDNSKMLSARDALQRIVGRLKADMTSALGVDITFIDNDGD